MLIINFNHQTPHQLPHPHYINSETTYEHLADYLIILYIKFMNILLQILISLVVIDFLVAAAHWFEDNYLYYDYPFFLLNQISKDNELHHYIPRVITYYSYAESMYVPTIITLCLLITLNTFTSIKVNKYPAIYITSLVLGSFSNVVHKWQHQRDCERYKIVTLLYKYRILVSSEKHRMHHKGDKDAEFYKRSDNYGIIFHILNNLYDSLKIWPILEKGVAMCGITKCNQRSKYPYQDTFDMECPPPLKKENVSDYIRRLQHMYEVEKLSKCQQACSYK